MTQTKPAPSWPVNENGEVIASIGTGSATGDSLYTYKSTFDMTIDYLAQRVAANDCDILTLTEFYYG